jgi:hypothetical protein
MAKPEQNAWMQQYGKIVGHPIPVRTTGGAPTTKAGARAAVVATAAPATPARAGKTVTFGAEEVVADKGHLKEIDQGIANVVDRANGVLTRRYAKMSSKLAEWEDKTQTRIEKMPGDPSDYFALIDILTGTINGILIVAFPEAKAVGYTLTVVTGAVAGARTAGVADVKEERSKSKQRAVQAMRDLAKKLRDKINGWITESPSKIREKLKAVSDAETIAILARSGDEDRDFVLRNVLHMDTMDGADDVICGQMALQLDRDMTKWLKSDALKSYKEDLEKMPIIKDDEEAQQKLLRKKAKELDRDIME